MKRTICFLLTALLLAALLSGCDLRNRQPSSDFIPQTEPTEPTQTTEPTEPQAPTEETESASKETAVRETLSETGTYTDRYGTTYHYDFHIPYIDSETAFAQGCNREISERFEQQVKAQLTAMETGEALSVVSVDYLTKLRGSILTLYITVRDVENERTTAVYTVDQKTGEQVAGIEIIKYVGLDEETFLPLAQQAVSDAFEQTYGESEQTDAARYNTAKDRTMAEENISAEMPMYIDQSDRLVILATVYDLAGAKHTEPLVIEITPPAED